jgi:transposase-like protein
MVPHFSSAASMTQNTRSGVGKLSDDQRKAIALQALARTESISVLAQRNGVSRPTVYRQIGTASAALDEAFDTTRATDADQVLFMLPVNRQWLEQVIVALTMVGHVSFRTTLELMHELLGVSTSLGTIHTVLQQAAQRAMAITAGVNLSAIRVGLHDELFQGSQPVLAGIDVASTYCYLLGATRAAARDVSNVGSEGQQSSFLSCRTLIAQALR